MLYLSTTDAGPPPYPRNSLATYGRAFKIKAGEMKTLDLAIPVGAIARAEEGNLVVFPGTYTLTVDYDGKIPAAFELVGEAATIDVVLVPPTKPGPISYFGLLCGCERYPSRQTCADRCAEAGYELSGLKNKSQCYCGSSLALNAAVIPDSACGILCLSGLQETCGGTNL
ncbi:hypothetical protein HD806DRAFT_524982 [Xylariaceae sp. AK1471]|nr:hypothetical protein HD806DRAFT_524982 [Xylariaceae sp. AK1471]